MTSGKRTFLIAGLILLGAGWSYGVYRWQAGSAAGAATPAPSEAPRARGVPVWSEVELGYRLRRSAWNKGYGTEEHLMALNQLGPCRHHRRSFAPVYHILRPVNPEDSILTA